MCGCRHDRPQRMRKSSGGLHKHHGSAEPSYCEHLLSTSSDATGPNRRGILLAAFLAAGASLLLLGLPVYATSTVIHSVGPSGNESSASASGTATLLEVNGPRGGLPLAIPVAIAVVPLLVPGTSRRRVAAYVCTGALVLFVILAGMSIGAFYAPSALAMVLAIAQEPWRRAAP